MKRTKSEERERKRKYRQNRTAEKVLSDREKDKARKGEAKYVEAEDEPKGNKNDEIEENQAKHIKRTKSEERERKRKYRQNRTAEKVLLDQVKDKAKKKEAKQVEVKEVQKHNKNTMKGRKTNTESVG